MMQLKLQSVSFLIAAAALFAVLAAAQPVRPENGDGGPALKASINGPSAISVDKDGNIYFIEMITDRIRKVNAKTGVIDTVAAGRDCCVEDELKSPGTSLFAPVSLDVDGTGNFYTDDLAGYVWRFESSTDTQNPMDQQPATLMAAKPGAGSPFGQFARLEGIASDGKGAIFVVESSSGKIYKILQDAATIFAGNGGRTFAGDGRPALEAAFNWPDGIAFNPSDDLIIADYENCRVRKIDKATNLVSTIAGTGECTSTGDGGKASDATINHPSAIAIDREGNIYITDLSPACVRRIDAETATIRSIPGTCESKPGRSGSPSGLAVDSGGNLYISLFGSNVIRRIDAKTGTVRTIAGNGLPDRFDVSL